MSFFEFFALFHDQRRFFGIVLGGVWVLVSGVYFFQPPRYINELWLTVTRTQVSTPTEYAYDHFYRFQADERLTESVAAFLMSDTGKQQIAEKAKLEDGTYQQFLEEKLKAVRQGTNELKVSYYTSSRDGGVRLGEAVLMSANAHVFAMNEDARQKEWFTIIGTKAVGESADWSFGRFVFLGLMAGFLVAFWAVVTRFFWSEYQDWCSRRKGQ